MKKHVENNRKIKNKVIKAVTPVALIGVLAGGIAACNKKSDTVETINIATPTPTPVEEVIEEIVTPELDLTSLDVTNSDSIHYFAEQNYTEYQVFYVKHGMTVQDIEEMILTINDRYVDEEGNLLITADEVLNAYTNLATILKSDDIVQTIDNIHFYMNGQLSEENLEEIELIDNQPSILSLIDTHIEGSEYTIENVSEYQEMRNNLVSNLNAYLVYNFDKFEDLRDENIDPSTVMPYNTEAINNYLFDQEIYEYNNNRDNMDNVVTYGYRWLIDATNLDACNITSMVNPNRYVITDPETGIDLQINYRPYNDNRFSQYGIYTQADTINYGITANFNGLTIPEPIVTEIVIITSTMPGAKYFADLCNDESQTYANVSETEALVNENARVLNLSN